MVLSISSCRIPQSSSLPGKKGSSSTSSSSSLLSKRARISWKPRWTGHLLLCAVVCLYCIKLFVSSIFCSPGHCQAFRGKGAMNLYCCHTVVCRPSISSLKQLAPSKFLAFEGRDSCKMACVTAKFHMLCSRKALLLPMWKGAQTLSIAAPTLRWHLSPSLQKRLTFTTYRKWPVYGSIGSWGLHNTNQYSGHSSLMG